MEIHSAASTETGLVRDENEDAFLAVDTLRFYAVADGLGGLPGGAEASRAALETIDKGLPETGAITSSNLEQIVAQANRSVMDKGMAISTEGIGTTLTAMQIQEGRLLLAHVGDSAAFLITDSEWKKLTTDHTAEEEYRQAHPGSRDADIPAYLSHCLTRCLGQKDCLTVDILEYSIGSAGRIILCTDGVTRMVPPDELAVMARQATTPKQLCRSAMRRVMERGAPDNATVIAVFMDE